MCLFFVMTSVRKQRGCSEGGAVPQCSDFHGFNETRRWRDPVPSGPGGASLLLDGRGGWGVVFQPRLGFAAPPQPPPLLTDLIFHFCRSWSLSNFWVSSSFSWWWFGWSKGPLQPAFSVAGSWCRDLAAASVSAAGGAAPVLRGLAASWSWTRWTAEEQSRVRLPQPPAPKTRSNPKHIKRIGLEQQAHLQAVQQHGGRLLHGGLRIGPGAAAGSCLVPAGL